MRRNDLYDFAFDTAGNDAGRDAAVPGRTADGTDDETVYRKLFLTFLEFYRFFYFLNQSE